MHKGGAGRDALVLLILILMTCAFYSPVFKNMDRAFSSVDWYEKYCFMASARKTVLDYGQFPLRSPFIAGGYPTIGHAYDDTVNPLFVAVLMFGELTGLRIIVFSLFIIGALGMFYLTRRVLNYNLPGAFFSAATFILCSYGACQFTEGNLEKLYLYFLPWLLAFFIKAKNDARYIVAACLVLSMILIKGVIVISALLFLLLVACFWSIERKGRRISVNGTYMAICLAVICLALGLCAPKILAALDLLGQKQGFIHFPFENSYRDISRYIVEQGRALSSRRLFDALLVKDAYIIVDGDFSQMYLGYIPVALFFLAIFFSWRKWIRFLVLLAVFIAIAAGPLGPVDVFKILWNSNPFGRFIWKLDEAFYIYIFFLISVIAGGAFLLLEKIKRDRGLSVYVAWILIFLSVAHMFRWNQRFLFHPDIQLRNSQFDQRVPHLAPQKNFFQVQLDFPEKSKDDYFYIMQNVGVTNFSQDVLARIEGHAIPKYFVPMGGYRHLADPASALTVNPAYKGEAFFRDGENYARMRYFSPNQMRIEVTVKNPDTLIVNQNYHKSWRTNRGRMSSDRGLLAVALQRIGTYEVVLTYVPVEVYGGFLISLASLACLFILFRFKTRIPALCAPKNSRND